LESQGYKVHLFNLQEPSKSTKWNPLSGVQSKLKTFLEIDATPITLHMNIYYFRNKGYKSNGEAERIKNKELQDLSSLISQEVETVINTICPIGKVSDESWSNGARDFILGCAYQFVELIKKGVIPIDKFNLNNIVDNIIKYSDDGAKDADQKQLHPSMKQFLELYSKTSEAYKKASTIAVSSGKTLTSFQTSVNQYLSWMSDIGIQSAVSEDELDLINFDEQPTALFITIDVTRPDSKSTLLASVLVTQIYKSFTEKANINRKNGLKASLKRKAYFMLDEFCNLPKMPIVSTIVTYGRGAGIVFMPAIQDYSQLKMYGDDAEVIKSNCNTQIFLGSKDQQTLQAFSDSLGKKRVASIGYSSSKDTSTSLSAQTIPLMPPSEIQTINKPGEYGNLIMTAYKNQPVQSYIIPHFQAKEYYGECEVMEIVDNGGLFDAKESYYDITVCIDEFNKKAGKKAEEETNDGEDAEAIMKEREAINQSNSPENLIKRFEAKKQEAVKALVWRVRLAIESTKGVLPEGDIQKMYELSSIASYNGLEQLQDTLNKMLRYYITGGLAAQSNEVARVLSILYSIRLDLAFIEKRTPPDDFDLTSLESSKQFKPLKLKQ
jgi:hypothetical protein